MAAVIDPARRGPSASEPVRKAPAVAETPERRPSRRGQMLESLGVFLVFGIAYGLLGYRTTVVDHVIVFDALDPLARAYMVFWNDPPKLAAVGFVTPPLTAIVLLPLAVIKPLATSLVALPVLSATFAAGTIVVLNSTFRRCEMPTLLRYPVLLAFGLNPLWLFYAGNGMGDAVYLFFLAFGTSSFIAWYCTEDVIHLMGAGTALAAASLTRYGILSWALLSAVLVAAALARRGAERDEVEGSTLTYAAPVVYAVTLWTLLSALIVDSPFGWLRPRDGSLPVNAAQSAEQAGASVGDILSNIVTIVASVAPLAFVVVALLVVAFVVSRDSLALWLAGLVALSIGLIGAAALLSDELSKVVLRAGLPVSIAALFGVAWLYRVANGLRIGVAVAAVALLLVSIPLTWSQMKDYPFQNHEEAFTRSLAGDGDQSGQESRGGFTVGVADELAMAARIKRLVGDGRNAILTDNAQTFGVILMTGRPDLFFDRVDEGEETWRSALDAPEGRVRYMLVSAVAAGDEIRTRYPTAATGASSRFAPVFMTERYVLVRVGPRPARRPATRGPGQPAAPTRITP